MLRGPLGESLQNVWRSNGIWKLSALITEQAAKESMSPQAGTSASGYDTGSITETIMC
jgi:hypothetical protein